MIDINELVIETTRRCNMTCGHCLRGDAENIDLKEEYIDNLLEGVENIGHVTFTGGEPSLNVPIINYFLDKCEELNINLGGFYIATNGLDISVDFVIVCLRAYAMCDVKDMCSVNVSNDYFHAAEGRYNTKYLDGLSFFSRKHEEENYDYDSGRDLLSEGRGEEYECGPGNHEAEILTIDALHESTLHLSCKGDIINGPNWSFETQDKGEYTLCKSNELASFIDGLAVGWGR